jgi:hypothetical protein
MDPSVTQGFRIKYILGGMALSNASRFLATFRGEGGLAYLRDLWGGLGLELEESNRVPGDGINIEIQGEVLVLRLPEPRRQNEAHAVGVAGTSDSLRVFFLEKTAAPPEPPFAAMIIELMSDGRANFGPLGDTTTASFAQRIAEIVNDC